jgi:hypothetical protein
LNQWALGVGARLVRGAGFSVSQTQSLSRGRREFAGSFILFVLRRGGDRPMGLCELLCKAATDSSAVRRDDVHERNTSSASSLRWTMSVFIKKCETNPQNRCELGEHGVFGAGTFARQIRGTNVSDGTSLINE